MKERGAYCQLCCEVLESQGRIHACRNLFNPIHWSFRLSAAGTWQLFWKVERVGKPLLLYFHV